MVTARSWAKGAIMLMLAALPSAALPDDTAKVVASPKELIGQQVTVSCQFAYAQETSPTWCEVYNGSGQEVGTIYVYLINIPKEDRLRAIRYCADQNPRKNDRNKCMVTLTGRVSAQSQKAFLTAPVLEWANE